MDIICKNCGEPWDLYFLAHEEKIFKDPKEIERGMYESGDFVYKPYLGFDEAYEGHFQLLYCPACRQSKYRLAKRTKKKLEEPADPLTELARQAVKETRDIPAAMKKGVERESPASQPPKPGPRMTPNAMAAPNMPIPPPRSCSDVLSPM